MIEKVGSGCATGSVSLGELQDHSEPRFSSLRSGDKSPDASGLLRGYEKVTIQCLACYVESTELAALMVVDASDLLLLPRGLCGECRSSLLSHGSGKSHLESTYCAQGGLGARQYCQARLLDHRRKARAGLSGDSGGGAWKEHGCRGICSARCVGVGIVTR